jgi:hypothetical protein
VQRPLQRPPAGQLSMRPCRLRPTSNLDALQVVRFQEMSSGVAIHRREVVNEDQCKMLLPTDNGVDITPPRYMSESSFLTSTEV